MGRSSSTSLGVNPSLTIAALVERAVANRVRALGQPDAAEVTPAEVLAGAVPSGVGR